MSRKVKGFLSLREAFLNDPERRRYWRSRADQTTRMRAENAALNSLTDVEANELEWGKLPPPQRIAQLAAEVGLECEHLECFLQSLIYRLTEGLHVSEGDSP